MPKYIFLAVSVVCVVFFASPSWALWQAVGANQVGVKVLDTSYSYGQSPLLVTVSGIIHKVQEEEFHISTSLSAAGPFVPVAVKHMKPFATDNIDTIVALVAPRSFYRVSSAGTGAVIFSWYELCEDTMPVEVALAGLWVLSFLGGVLVGRL